MRIIGTLMSLPYMILFFTLWVIASIARPFLIVSLMCLVTSGPAAAFHKLQICYTTILYLLFCHDKTWKQPKEDPDSFFQNADATKIERKTMFFVRHGESTWNDTFNKGDRSTLNFILYFLPNLLKSIAMEWYFWVSGQANESWFYDSPLSEKGLGQARNIQKFLQTNIEYAPPKEAEMIRLLVGDKLVASQLVSSNLRRAISTMVVGFQDRLNKTYDKDNILVLTCLQEISRNPDALSITPPKGKVLPAWTDPKPLHMHYENGRIDTTLHTGNKPVTTNGLLRLQEFCKIAFQDIQKDNIIVGGHSLWFRSFFRTYLPHSSNHVSKHKKLVNGGVVGFTLERIAIDNNMWAYRIDPKTLVVLHGGF